MDEILETGPDIPGQSNPQANWSIILRIDIASEISNYVDALEAVRRLMQHGTIRDAFDAANMTVKDIEVYEVYKLTEN